MRVDYKNSNNLNLSSWSDWRTFNDITLWSVTEDYCSRGPLGQAALKLVTAQFLNPKKRSFPEPDVLYTFLHECCP